ncbi:MAG: SRPBCC family protein [Halocynthiibacter sp.]
MPVAEPFTRLEYTFTIAPMGDATSTLKWNLEDVAGGTRLSLRHDGLPQGADMFGLTLALDTGGTIIWPACVMRHTPRRACLCRPPQPDY